MGRSAARRKASAQKTAPAARSAERPMSSAPDPALRETSAPLPRLTWAVAPLVFGTGFCALVYQIAWQREFRLVFGTSTAASAAVIAVFMGALGLGAWILGPRADARLNPLRFYALLEAGVALTAAATPVLLDLVRRAYIALGGTVVLGEGIGTLVRLVLASLVLLAPTFLAGGTLGAAARAVEHASDHRRRATGLLYGLNTLGAVAGCLVATFGLLEAAGTRATLWSAAVLNVTIALVAGWLAAGRPIAPDGPRQVPGPSRDAAASGPGFVAAAAGIVGFAYFLMELVWYRMLGPILGGTVYTFGLVLAVALFGIGAGGVVYAAASRRIPSRLHAFAVTCVLEAACVALPYALGDRIALLALALRPAPGALLADYLFGWTTVAALVVLPASMVAGVQFPLLVALLGGPREHAARNLGRAYFWNTAGGIVGALAGGFGLLPLLTAPGCWRAAALLLAGLGLLAAVVDRACPPRVLLAVGAGVAVVAATLLLAEGPTAAWRHGSIGVGRATVPASLTPRTKEAWIREMRRSIVWEQEGVESSVAVQALAGLSLVINGKVDGNARNDAPTQVMGGLLGAFLRPAPQRSMVIGLGTGSTAGWLAAVPGMQRTDVVELEPAVLEVARRCGPVNRDVMGDPRVNVVRGDAREVLITGRDRYDLVFSEPSNPYRAGVASLFTREFYQAVASRLTPDGLFVQWVQAYEVDDRTMAAIVATMGDVFPAIEVWQVHQADLVLVASQRPLRHDASALRARLRQEPFASALRHAWRATDLEDVLARFVAGSELTRRMSQGADRNTDDRNIVEFSFARTLSRTGLFDVVRLREAAAAIGADRPAVEGTVDAGRVAHQRTAIYTIAGKPAPTGLGSTEAERVRLEAHSRYLAGELQGAVAHFRRDGPTEPEGAVETAIFAEGLADAGDPAAVPYIQALSAISLPEAEAAAGRLAFRAGRHDVARDALVSAFRRYRGDPWPGQVAMSHALSLAQELAAARPDMAPVLADALAQPFAVAALEEPRRLVRLYIAMGAGTGYRCQDAIQAFEPNVPWRAEILEFRASCYRRTLSPRAAEALADLDDYRRSY